MSDVLECPECGKTGFSSEQYLRVHHKQAHGERLDPEPNAECENCGEEFYRRPNALNRTDRTFCSQDCRASFGYETLACDHCGTEFERKNCKVGEQNFCSHECAHRHSTGENNPAWRGGHVEVECDFCGEDTTVPKCHEDLQHHFCDRSCFHDWLGANGNFVGESNPRWAGGVRVDYGEGWDEEKREQVREAQGRKCAGCGLPEDEHPTRLPVHHIQKARAFDDPERRNAEANLVALCWSCHRKWEQMSPLRPLTPHLDL